MRIKRFCAAALCALGATAVLVPAAAAAAGDKDKDTTVQLLAFNDFHGHLEPNTPGTIQVGQRRVAAASEGGAAAKRATARWPVTSRSRE